MAEYVTRDEFEARVGVLEQEVEGEKLVTRYILDQTRRNGDDLAALKSRMDRMERKFDGLERKVDGLDRKVDGLIKTLPEIIGEAVRGAFQERDRKA